MNINGNGENVYYENPPRRLDNIDLISNNITYNELELNGVGKYVIKKVGNYVDNTTPYYGSRRDYGIYTLQPNPTIREFSSLRAIQIIDELIQIIDELIPIIVDEPIPIIVEPKSSILRNVYNYIKKCNIWK